ncbi:MAG: hypothetical protein NDI82_05950 [Anaeromyxobacteraceae bacterium]|nr:hypothetical protein [Anaeromyxobacteraceae bacterium]
MLASFRRVMLPPLLAGLLAACGGSSSAPRIALQASLGTYDDGSGRLGLALITTLRDASGAGPEEPWTITVRDPQGGLVQTVAAAAGPGAYQLGWKADLPPSPGSYAIVASSAAAEVRVAATLAESGGNLGTPAVAVAGDGSRLDWPPVPGAASYLCRIHAAGTLQHEALGTGTTCDLSALPAGAYSASVLAFSADVVAVSASPDGRPSLPARFDASEARLGFVRPAGPAPALVLRAAGGAYDDGVDPRSLAIWLSVGATDGAASSAAWDVEVVGPNLPAEAPLRFVYHASFPRTLVWAPGSPATPGTYSAIARSGSLALISTFTVGAPAWLDQPMGLVATDAAQGAADASWAPVAGARSYLLTAYEAASGQLVASAWFAGSSGSFPAATFTPGVAYDVYLAATDADMASGTAPAQVSVAENVFDFARFVAR